MMSTHHMRSVLLVPLVALLLLLGFTLQFVFADKAGRVQKSDIQADIILSHTVGLRQIGCPAQDNVAAQPGTPLSFCLTLRNSSDRILTSHKMTRTIDWFPRLTTEVYTFSFALAPGETFTFTSQTLAEVFAIPDSFNEEAADVDMLVDVIFSSSDGEVSVTEKTSATVYVPSIRVGNGVDTKPGCATQDALVVARRATIYPCVTVENKSRLATTLTAVESSWLGSLVDEPLVLAGLETISLPLAAGGSIPRGQVDQRFVSTTTVQATSRDITATDSVTLSLYVLARETFLPYLSRQ